ncbi:MAG TPA: patatin-like phospholipase family protein, partial [Candidatus Polarisedimenticolia bacterium]|nr:patatin-like phospholipase family protein [Candidatus Polarisedimenticolia bacterium]
EELKRYHEELKTIWFGIKSDSDIYSKRFLGKVLVFLAKNSMFDHRPLFEMLKRYASPDRIARSRKELRIGAVSLETGNYCEVDQAQPNLLDWTLASCSMPLFFPPVTIGKEHYVDGGVRSITPLQGAFAALKELSPNGEGPLPDEMYVILASPLHTPRVEGPWKTGQDVGQRAAGILVNQIYREDLDYALTINEAVRGYRELRSVMAGHLGTLTADSLLSNIQYPYRPPHYREVRIWTIVPSQEFSESLQFEPKRIRAAFDAGREAAKTKLDATALRALLDRTNPRKEIHAAEPLRKTA